MSRSPIVNFATTLITWLPVAAVLAAGIWILCVGAMHLEMITNGSEVFVSNKATSNTPSWARGNGGNDQASQLMDAYNSGDPQAMARALSN